MSEQGAALLQNHNSESEENNHWDFSKISLLIFLSLLLAGSLTTLFLLFYNPDLLTSFTSATLEALTTASLVTSCIFIMLIASMISKNRTTLVGWIFTIASCTGWILGLVYPELFSVFAKYAQIASLVFFTATTIFQRKEWAAFFVLIITIAAIATLCLALTYPSLLGFLDCTPESIVVKSLFVATAGCILTVGIIGFEAINNKMRGWKKFYGDHHIAANIIRGAVWVLIILLICLPAALWINDWHLTHWTKLDVDLDSATILSKFTLGMQCVMIFGFLTFWWVKNTLNEATKEAQNEPLLPNAPQSSGAVSYSLISENAKEQEEDEDDAYEEKPDIEEKKEKENKSENGKSETDSSDEDDDEESSEEDSKNNTPPQMLATTDQGTQFPSPPNTVTPASSAAIIAASSSSTSNP